MSDWGKPEPQTSVTSLLAYLLGRTTYRKSLPALILCSLRHAFNSVLRLQMKKVLDTS